MKAHLTYNFKSLIPVWKINECDPVGILEKYFAVRIETELLGSRSRNTPVIYVS